jgi:UDP-N-acetylglucosamine:LPS N-acetylglucosamine transferase
MTIVIAAGGTGGHLYPAIALAREFIRRNPASTVLFVGTTRGLESKVLAHEGFKLILISAKPVMGKRPKDFTADRGRSRDRGRRLYEPDDGDGCCVDRNSPCDSGT